MAGTVHTVQGMRAGDRFAYLVTDGRTYGPDAWWRVGRGRALVEFYELGSRVRFALELEGAGWRRYGLGASIATAPRNEHGEHPTTFV